MQINFKQCNAGNYQKNRTQAIKYIVIHYTGNEGDTANNNAVYFAREKVGRSAHYFVDENEVWQSVPASDTAWHCGGKRQGSKGGTYLGKCTNNNSLGIEICILDKNGNIRTVSIKTAIKLTKMLMKKYNISIDKVIRHFDVTGKGCPLPMVQKPELWKQFKQDLLREDEEQMKIYKYVPDMPEWARDTFTRLYKAGVIKADANGEIAVQESSLQPMVYLDRLTGGKIEKLSDILK